jgi:UDP-N-acetylglucosamine 2-epimerase (non-hydrolysing)/GDP/UDP-N,N'-diacetylbacillosamine 2-epimerase (hydrolysing)
VVTVARSDYGIYIPVLREIERDPALKLHLIVSGMHLSPEFGNTVSLIREDGFAVGDSVEMPLSSDTPCGIAKSMGTGTAGYAESFSRIRPDILVVLGDRFEMHAAALAALPFKIPVAHIHGGELTFGAIDDALRHCITKLSHLHFPATEEYARRVIQMGEEPWRVTVSGAPGLDHLTSLELLDRETLERRFHLRLDAPPLLCTFHPVTLEFEDTGRQIAELLAALEPVMDPIVFTMPNADTGGRMVLGRVREFAGRKANAYFVENLGTQAYFSLMKMASAMIGNSSSGIIEAASFRLPVVNVGNRQAGRFRGRNVIDTGCTRAEIAAALSLAQNGEFRASLAGLENPYGRGRAAETIVRRLKEEALGDGLLIKRFFDQERA